MRQQKHPAHRIILTHGTTGVTIVAQNVIPYDKLPVNADGFAVHIGTASGNQVGRCAGSKFDTETIGKETVTFTLRNGTKMTMTTIEAELLCAHVLQRSSEINRRAGAGTTATS